MRSKTLAVAVFGALLGVAVAASASAQTVTDPNQAGSDQSAVKKKQKNPPARVTVEKRSFLDAGTEVLPGQRKFNDYAFPPGYSPHADIDFTTANVRGTLVGPWDTSRKNFWPW